jgi:hypothetical protein
MVKNLSDISVVVLAIQSFTLYTVGGNRLETNNK